MIKIQNLTVKTAKLTIFRNENDHFDLVLTIFQVFPGIFFQGNGQNLAIAEAGLCVDFVQSTKWDFPTSIFFKVMQAGFSQNHR